MDERFRVMGWLSVALLATAVLSACGGAGGGDGSGSDAADVARGEDLYRTNCAACHGPAAEGTGQGPPLVHELYVPSHHSDASFVLAARNGVTAHHWDFGPMPPRPELDDDDVADVVAWVRQLQRDAGLIP